MKTATLRTLCTLLLLIPLSACFNNRQTLTLVTFADGTRGLKTPVDTGAPGPTQGDLFIFDQPLKNEGGQDIGSNSGYCVTTLPGAHSQCQWTLIFVDAAKNVIGTIVVGGQEHETGLSTVAILGSTGKYAGFTGHMISEPMPDGTFKQTLYLVPH
ncbi:hypothetical protein [Pseudomonas trivialis]|uniref:Lipoprotein n=1 Tax=Pseudomonas trivialis TaxID=200450 RepID=A0A0H5A694_9PSED|nr:hypothetical protein [Pseudomonas trivialis]AKS05468.1 hypothetical protein AA957_04895 [Pseudomonas trivialis]